VGTPQRKGEYPADLTYVSGAIEAMLPHLSEGDLVVGKSTVPVGTADNSQRRYEILGLALHSRGILSFCAQGSR
jgi:UDPglucose 6-dehydrogenase